MRSSFNLYCKTRGIFSGFLTLFRYLWIVKEDLPIVKEIKKKKDIFIKVRNCIKTKM